MRNIIPLFLLICNTSISQTSDSTSFISDFLIESELKSNNCLNEFAHYDFSEVFNYTKEKFVVGIIGNDHKRIRIKFLSIEKSKNPTIYHFKGKSKVGNNICDFEGHLKILQIRLYKEFEYGVDHMYKDSNITNQGLIIAKYVFYEDSTQKYSGKFEGYCYSKWFEKNNQIHYNNIANMSDTYTNNAFIGEWEMYHSKVTKNCTWADYRVPYADSGFDTGAGEFHPNEKYHNKGWSSYMKEAYSSQTNEWWK